MKFIENLIVAILGIVMFVAFMSALTNPSSTSSNSSHSYYDGRSHTGRNTWARENTPPPVQPQQESNNVPNYSTPAPAPVYTTTSRSYGSGNSHYAELWSECEDMEALLEDNDIDHEYMSYPMDYYELRDLRDEYQNLLEEYEIDY